MVKSSGIARLPIIFPTKNQKLLKSTRGDMTIDEKYDLISDCSLLDDELGNKFGPISSDFCVDEGDVLECLSPSRQGNPLRESGAFWFSGASYSNFDMFKILMLHTYVERW